ncbi:hypothetical protein NOCARDAX2BIS_220143 [Nocardioides sp. AX2bis]|nr:hypothetical protein NOCARDAX2BIS_220143 [Nocardioides sp. AX2bis]
MIQVCMSAATIGTKSRSAVVKSSIIGLTTDPP